MAEHLMNAFSTFVFVVPLTLLVHWLRARHSRRRAVRLAADFSDWWKSVDLVPGVIFYFSSGTTLPIASGPTVSLPLRCLPERILLQWLPEGDVLNIHVFLCSSVTGEDVAVLHDQENPFSFSLSPEQKQGKDKVIVHIERASSSGFKTILYLQAVTKTAA